MDKKTKGAWLIHHRTKIRAVPGPAQFDEIDFAGKCGAFLSALAADNQATLSTKQVHAIAKAVGLSVHTDLPAILSTLNNRRLIDQGKNGLSVLGITQEIVLQNASDIFDETTPSSFQSAALELAEISSQMPMLADQVSKQISDLYRLSTDEVSALIELSTCFGFVDIRKLDSEKQILFNGNLFRVENSKKVAAVLESLSSEERDKMKLAEELLTEGGCAEESQVVAILGQPLFDKLQSIGLYDQNTVSNANEEVSYVMRPGSLGKYGSSIPKDAMDYAKAFVASLTYGMTRSRPGRGRIRMLDALLNKLISGQELAPSSAAGEDYRYLELHRVVKVTQDRGSMFRMKLLKKGVGQLAAQVLMEGDANLQSLASIPSSPMSNYTGPESNRLHKSKALTSLNKTKTAELLNDLRTGSL